MTVEEQSREIFTATSNMLEASKETTSPYIEQGNCEPLAGLKNKQPLGRMHQRKEVLVTQLIL